MNSSLWSAGHTTHLKIGAVSLIASIVVVAIGINARFDSATTVRTETDQIVIKAGKPAIYTDSGRSTIR
jgi:hypothetical protein